MFGIQFSMTPTSLRIFSELGTNQPQNKGIKQLIPGIQSSDDIPGTFKNAFIECVGDAFIRFGFP